METIEIKKSDSNESVQDLETDVVEEVKSEIRTDYFRFLDNNEYELVSNDVPKSEHTQISILNSFYNMLCMAAQIPEFTETANGILELFTERKITRYTYENVMIAVASAISINPAFAWWLMFNGGIVMSNFLLLVIEFSVLNPTKVVVLYGFSRKITSLIKLYNYIYK